MTHDHPGEYLRRRLEEAGVTGYRIALDTGISASTLTRVAIGERNIQPELAVLLAEYLGDDPSSG